MTLRSFISWVALSMVITILISCITIMDRNDNVLGVAVGILLILQIIGLREETCAAGHYIDMGRIAAGEVTSCKCGRFQAQDVVAAKRERGLD